MPAVPRRQPPSSATRSRSGSGPPSISSRPPRDPSTQDRVALADIEHRDRGRRRRRPRRPRDGRGDRDDDRRAASGRGPRPASSDACAAGVVRSRLVLDRRAAVAPPASRWRVASRPPPARRPRARRRPAARRAGSDGGSNVDAGQRQGRREPSTIRDRSAAGRPSPGREHRLPITAGAPGARATPPASSATSPRPSPARRAGRRARFTTGAISASRPKRGSTTGSVAACAASETPRHSASQPRDVAAARHARAGPSAASPRRAARRSPAPRAGTRRRRRAPGSASSRRTAAQPSAAAAAPRRPLSRARSTTPAITAARTTDGDAPAKAM